VTELKVLGPDEKALKREKIVDVLWALQKQRGYIDDDAVRLAGQECDLTPAEVDEVATFYNLLLRRPAGRRQIFLCDSISCELRGASTLIAEVEKQLGARLGEVTADGEFGLLPIVCLGHCEMAPCLLANEKVYGPLATDPESVGTLLERIRNERSPAPRQA
jgi:NADH-quinone oxidoreductase subunit E